jgi:hypothetical protein
LKKRSPARPWYAGRTPPAEEVLAIFDNAGEPEVLYNQADPDSIEGDFASLMKSVYGKMDSLKRSPQDFRTWTDEDGYATFYEALLDYAPAEIKGRVGILQQLGTFKFRGNAGPDEKKKLISAVFDPQQEGEDPRIITSSRARRLSQIWGPPTDSLLDFILARAAQAGRVLSDRLNPTNPEPFRLIGHPFKNVRSTELQPIANARVIAFERDGDIHIVPVVRKSCDQWDADAAAVGGVEQVSLIETLLLHEIVELVMHEQHPELPPLCCHIVATTFERYLKADLLTVAVEDFFFSWPAMSEDEEAERLEEQLQQEMREAEAMFAEEEAPEDLDDDISDLPMDDAPPPKKKKKKSKKKVASGKVQPGGKTASGKAVVAGTKKKLVKKKKE